MNEKKERRNGDGMWRELKSKPQALDEIWMGKGFRRRDIPNNWSESSKEKPEQCINNNISHGNDKLTSTNSVETDRRRLWFSLRSWWNGNWFYPYDWWYNKRLLYSGSTWGIQSTKHSLSAWASFFAPTHAEDPPYSPVWQVLFSLTADCKVERLAVACAGTCQWHECATPLSHPALHICLICTNPRIWKNDELEDPFTPLSRDIKSDRRVRQIFWHAWTSVIKYWLRLFHWMSLSAIEDKRSLDIIKYALQWKAEGKDSPEKNQQCWKNLKQIETG